MQFSPSNFITPELILSDVLPLVNENGDFRELSKGFYYQQIQKALEALSFGTYFDERMVSLPVPDNLAIEIPKGMFNLRQMYLNTGDGCGIGANSVNVYFKDNFFNNDGKGSANYVARNKGSRSSQDPFYGRNKGTYLGNVIDSSNLNSDAGNERYARESTLYWYNIQNGIIMLSSSCKNYPYVVMNFNGISTEVGDKPVVPIAFREVVIDWVVEAVMRVKSSRDPNVYKAMYNDAVSRLGKNPFHTSGTWFEATQRAASLNSKDREDLSLYYSKFVK
jgi:hypothetical protein